MLLTDRRSVLGAGLAWIAFPGSAVLNLGCVPSQDGSQTGEGGSPDDKLRDNRQSPDPDKAITMPIYYLEIVTPDVEDLCTLYAKMHGVTFGDADASLGGALTVKLADGPLLGIRAPMHDGERPVVRPYLLVEDIEAAVEEASESGAMVALPPMEIQGHGTCAIVIQGGIESGLWQR